MDALKFEKTSDYSIVVNISISKAGQLLKSYSAQTFYIRIVEKPSAH